MPNSDSTYEELKRRQDKLFTNNSYNSDSTYEELKPVPAHTFTWIHNTFRLYLWGIETINLKG